MGRHIVETQAIVVVGLMVLAFGFFFPGLFGGPGWALVGSIPGLLVLLWAALQWLSDRRSEIREAEIAEEQYRNRERETELKRRSIGDSVVIEVARKYGGVLTKTTLAFETRSTLETAAEALTKFVEQGEARMSPAGDMTIYDIPAARVYLLHADKGIVELLVKHQGQADRHDLLRESGLSIEALDASLRRLETQALIHRTPQGKVYRLAAIP